MKTILFATALLFGSISFAQQTGDFQLDISFTEPDYTFNRTLYYHVPTNYNPAQSYKLVVGFRGGPHTSAGQFRDQLSFLSDSIGAIIICPENADHFWNQEGLTKQLFNYSLDTTLALYNIDTNFIYLTGLSYGGRHSVIVSMDTDNGAIPNLRGVIPFAAGSDSQLKPDYGDIGDFPPACICIGLNDSQNFINVSNTIHNDIQTNGGESFLNEITGVGHTVAFPTYPEEMMECFNFIEGTYSSVSLPENTDDGVQIFPNPASSTISIKGLENYTLSITDAQGRTMMQLEGSATSIDISSLASGTYYLMYSSDSVSGNRVITVK